MHGPRVRSRSSNGNYHHYNIIIVSRCCPIWYDLFNPYCSFYYTDAPRAPENVSVEASGVMPILQWNRVPGPVENYTVQVVQSEDGAVVLENTTSSLNFSLQEIEQEIRYTNQSCEIFEFTVKATNEAGTGPLSTAIMDTIPICKAG